MFFRRESRPAPTFEEKLGQLRDAGFTVAQSGGEVKVTRGEIGIVLTQKGGDHAGVVVGNEIGSLVDGGYQKFFRTPSGRTLAATADQLKAIHAFEEDLKAGMGEESFYNESLGTVSTFYLYDRVKDRDQGVPKRAWEN